MHLPSGEVYFGDAKANMLGFPQDKFKTDHDFMALVHPEDSENAMQAMRQHLSGEKPAYETVYRIQNSQGEYIKFYDLGMIIKKENENIELMGFVMKVAENQDILSQINEFKQMILNGNPSVIDLVTKMQAK